MRAMATIVVTVILSAGTMAAAAGDPSKCKGVTMREVRYWPAFADSDPVSEWRCDGDACEAWAWLYTPDQSASPAPDLANRPALIYIRGSGEAKTETANCAVAQYFVGKGFVVMFPTVRGVDMKRGGEVVHESTGTYFQDYRDTCAEDLECAVINPFTGACVTCSSGDCLERLCTADARNDRAFEFLHDVAKSEIADAVTYLDALAAIRPPGAPIDPAKTKLVGSIAIGGHSVGGIVALYANTYETRHNALVATSPNETSWDANPLHTSGLLDAMRTGNSPIFILQPKNAASLAPVQELSTALFAAGRRGQAAIFPRVIPEHDDGTPCSDAELESQAKDGLWSTFATYTLARPAQTAN